MQGNSVWVDGNVHSFPTENRSDAQSIEICLKLKAIAIEMSQQGFSQTTHLMSPNFSDEMQCRHNELAIVCALINTNKGETIHVLNSTYISSHCHLLASFISKTAERKIMVRDLKYLHVFEEGKCSRRPVVSNSLD